MIFNVIALLVGILILGCGVYFLMKEKDDPESRKIYLVVTGIGVVVAVIFVLRLVVFH